MVRDDDLIATYNGDDRRAFRQPYFLNRPPDDLGTVFVAVRDRLHRLGRTAPERVNLDNIAATDMRKQFDGLAAAAGLTTGESCGYTIIDVVPA